MKVLIASLQFITAIPLGKQQPFDAKGIMVHFPLAGLAIGLVLASFDHLAGLLWPQMVVAVLDVVLLAAISGGLHLDGLADTADGLCSHRERKQALAIMKDSRVGAMGMVAVVCLLLTKAAALGHVDQNRFMALTLVPAYARTAMLCGLRWLPYARSEGGTASAFFKTPVSAADFRWAAVPVIMSLFLGWQALLLNLLFAGVTVALIVLYRSKLGGITGDLLGAMAEIVETVLFVAMCLGGAA
ncbi:MAG: adenosylcobinamide-GDP ribazoletransferase [Desulfosarcina sp.]|jgi:adenosylcobinamide-GDP ribazoletransferase